MYFDTLTFYFFVPYKPTWTCSETLKSNSSAACACNKQRMRARVHASAAHRCTLFGNTNYLDRILTSNTRSRFGQGSLAADFEVKVRSSFIIAADMLYEHTHQHKSCTLQVYDDTESQPICTRRVLMTFAKAIWHQGVDGFGLALLLLILVKLVGGIIVELKRWVRDFMSSCLWVLDSSLPSAYVSVHQHTSAYFVIVSVLINHANIIIKLQDSIGAHHTHTHSPMTVMSCQSSRNVLLNTLDTKVVLKHTFVHNSDVWSSHIYLLPSFTNI
jgi:hypothetical protein